MVAGQDAKAARINGQGHIHAVFHGEIRYHIVPGTLVPGFRLFVFLKTGVDFFQRGQVGIILTNLRKPLLAYHSQRPDGILLGFKP